MPLTKKQAHINGWLLPFSWLYGFVVYLRNKFFKWGVLKRKSYNIPIICIGNLAVGGTGKTPHVEYLIKLLKDKYKVAVISRGYKRKTSGFILANTQSTASQIGDEPYQIWSKFNNIIVAVDGNRCRAIENLLALPQSEKPDVILLDDAFQHRYVKPSFSILLTDYNRPYFEDKLLPAGRLREPVSYSTAANIILVTKCPAHLKPIDLRVLSHEINAFPYQDLMFTSLSYGNLQPLFDTSNTTLTLNQLNSKEVLLISGIASPKPLIKKMEKVSKKLKSLIFPDHHNFSGKDIQNINFEFDKMNASARIVVLTEKDAVRIKTMNGLNDDVKKAMYYLPVQVQFINEDEKELFNNKILDHVRKN